MLYCFVGTKNKIVYVLEVFNDFASAKKERENIKKRYPEHQNISLKRGTSYYHLEDFGKIYNRAGLTKVIRKIVNAHVEFVNKDASAFTIKIKVNKIILNNKQTELF